MIRRTTPEPKKLHTMPITGVTLTDENMNTNDTPSPATLAALREDSARTPNLRARLDASPVLKRAREAGQVRYGGEREQIITRGEYADLLRLRTTVTNATGAVVPQWYRDTADSPEQGGRLPGLFRVREATEPAIGISEETGSRAAVVTVADYGVALPESAATYTKTELASSRFGAYIHAWKSILDDSQALADGLDYVLTRDMGRQIDVELLTGDGSGTAYGAHFTGLSNLSLTTKNVTGSTRWETLVDAAAAIRNADWLGPITTILNPLDLAKLVKEKATTTNAPVFEDALAALEALDANRFVFTALQTAGTAYSGSWSEFATLYVREAPTVVIANDDQDDFVKGMVKVKVEGRLTFRTHHTSAGIQITNF